MLCLVTKKRAYVRISEQKLKKFRSGIFNFERSIEMNFEQVKQLDHIDKVPIGDRGLRSVLNMIELSGIEVTSLGHVDDIPKILAAKSEEPLTEQELDFIWRAWPFNINFKDGERDLLFWDHSNGSDVYLCEITTESIRSVIEQTH